VRIERFKGALLPALMLISLIVLASLLHSSPISAQANPENTIVIVILHTNDIHSHLLAKGEDGGSAYIASIVDNEREQNPGRVLLLDAGDLVDGDPIGDLFHGRSVIEVMNAMGYDAMTVGNHDLEKYGGDYNYGVISIENDYLMDLKGIAKFPMLAANVRINNLDNSKQFAPYVIKEIDNVKIGIIGVTIPLSPPPENVQISDPDNAVRDCVKEIENQVDIIIALTHIGEYYDESLASHVENIDIVIGGHSHTVMSVPVTVGKTKIVQAGAYGNYVGRIRLEFNAENHENYNFSYNLIGVKHPPLEENQGIAEMVENYNSTISPIVDVKIGYTENALSYNETGKKIAESYKENTGADVGYNTDIRDYLPAGPITIRQIYKVLPYYWEKLMLMDLRGDYLKYELNYDYEAGAYKQNSQWYLENGELIEDNKYYRVAVDDYSGTRYNFIYGENITYHGLIQDAFINYLKEVFPFSIYIDGNDNFTPANGVSSGSGTENDPYIIENWDINAENTNGIDIRNTTSNFIVRNCYVHDGGVQYNGISLSHAINGILDKNISENNYYGIAIYESSGNTLSGNTCSNNSYEGIDLGSSSNNTLDNNACNSNNDAGIWMGASFSNTLSNNTCSNNSNNAILITSSSYNNLVSGNVAENNPSDGIHLDSYSDNNLISGNVVENNNRYGIELNLYSDNNLVYHNHIINNATQAYDDGSNYWDNGYPSGGNYWSDYRGVDENHGENQDIPGRDGIGDTPYPIVGGANQDRYPFVNSWIGTAENWKLENLYNVSLEKDLQLYTGSKLVVKFYDYGDTFENENVVDSVTPPQSIVENENVPHPANGSLPVRKAVKKAELVLTTDDTDNIISTIASFTVSQSDLRNRYVAILRAWAGQPEQQGAFQSEIKDILRQWSGAPS
jgi:5'-nucleotidase/UDP-sugar diphosphatase